MDSNDENIDSTEDSNSVSTDVKNDSTPLRDKILKKNTNIVFVSPNELEDWDIESKAKIKKTPRTKSNKVTPKTKIPKPTPKSSRKKRGRPKRKKLQNPWSSDIDDENVGLENEISDDEYFRRLEEASEVNGSTTEIVESLKTENVEIAEEYEEEEEEIYIGQMKTFDLNNLDLLNYILAERENSLYINDPSKPAIVLPPSSNDLKCPRDCVLQLLSIYETVIQYYKILRISPFKIEDFISAMISNENSNLLSELHISILKLLIREDEAANTSLCPLDQKDGINLAFHLIDSLTWSELLRMYVKSIDYKSQKVHISNSYPFVNIYDRITVLTYLLDLFVFGSSVRNEIARENLITHEDFCRVCHTIGEVLCCDSCSAVYHLSCLTPQLTCVPSTTWNCPICVSHKIPGLFDCNFDGEKALVEHKKTPLGQDRFGNTYWFIARRLIVEPRNDNIQNLVESILERDEEKDFEPIYDNVSYFSSCQALEKVRLQLKREWETELCDVFDSLIEEMKASMEVTASLTAKGMSKFSKFISKDTQVFNVLEEELRDYGQVIDKIKQETDQENIVENAVKKPSNSNEINKCTLKTAAGTPVGVIEDQEGLLVRNIDGSTVRVRLSAKTRSNQLEEVAAIYNCEIEESNDEGRIYYRLGDEGEWRFYVNFFNTEFDALSKSQHQEDKDRKRVLCNKYSLNECNEFQWYVSQAPTRATWFNLPINPDRPPDDILGGPLNMLQCIRLTLQNMEAQIFASFMCPAWKSERKNWLINIQRTRNAASLAEFLAIFESAIRGCSYKKTWTNSLGSLYLDRVTAAEREEEKKNKTLERKGMKPDGELVKTRNPGFLKHTIWKTKGEEYRRFSGDGWAWLNISAVYNKYKLRESMEHIKQEPSDPSENFNIKIHNVLKLPIRNSTHFSTVQCQQDHIDIGTSISNEEYYPINNQIRNSPKIEELLTIRLNEYDLAKKDFDLDEAQKKLSDLTNQRNEIRVKKESLEEKLDIVSKNYNKVIQWKLQQQNRKRIFQNYDQSFTNSGEKRMRYQNENSPFLGQYDGADDEDMSSSSEVQSKPLTATVAPANVKNVAINNVNYKPIVIPNPNNIGGLCVLNFSQNNTQNTTNRMVLNQQQQIKVDSNYPHVNGQWPASQFVRFPNNQLIRVIGPGNNTQGPSQIRKYTPGGQQFVIINNMPSISQASAGHPAPIPNGHIVNQSNLIYTPTNGVQVPIRSVALNNQQQQYKRLLPMEPAMMQQKPLPNIVNSQNSQNTPVYSNVIVGTSKSSTPVQGRRTISKVTHNTDTRMTPIADSNDELIQRKEMDNLCHEILSFDQQLDQLDRQIIELDTRIRQVTINISEPYKLFKKYPIDSKNEPDCDKLLPSRNLFKWPIDSKQFVRSVFLYKIECLRPVVLAAGRCEVPGFDVEKKRLNNIFWPYPTARPGFSSTWRYQVSRVINSDDIDERVFDLAATEPAVDPEHEKLKNVGSSGLSCLALCLKILWYSLRWDDMLINWQSSGIPPSITLSQGIYKETLLTGETLERKIIGWKPLDKYSYQCSYLVSICTTTTTVDSPGSCRSRGRPNRRGRQRASARYTDLDYFTDDGEIDSDDSDPNFIPGVSRVNKSRGRRPKNRNTDDFQLVKFPEKKFKEEWMDEESLELWEIRDYLTSISWRRFTVPQSKNKSQIVSAIMNKRENFQRYDSVQLMQRSTVIAPQIPTNTIGVTNPVIVTSAPSVNHIDISKTVPQIPVATIVKVAETLPDGQATVDDKSRYQDTLFSSQIEPSKVEPIQVMTTSNAINSSSKSIIITKTENLPSKLIIESSSKSSGLLIDNKPVPTPTPPAFPVPITDIREITRSSDVVPTGGVRVPSPGRSRGKGRGRGRGRGRPPMQHRSVSSNSGGVGPGEDTVAAMDNHVSKHPSVDDLILDMDSAVLDVHSRMTAVKQNVLDVATISAMNKADDLIFSELAKSHSKKTKKHQNRKESFYKDTASSEELTDREVETGSTSPAIDNHAIADEDNVSSTGPTRSSSLSRECQPVINNYRHKQQARPQQTRNLKRPARQKKKIKHESEDESSIPSEDETTVYTDDTLQTSENRSHGHPPARKRARKESSELSRSPRRTTKSRLKREVLDTGLQSTVSDTENEQEELYCICKTYDPTQKYIGCDYCERWFHFSCVQMTGKKVSLIDNWKCQICEQKENDKLYCSCQTKYDSSRVYIGCDYCDEWYHPSCIGMTDAEANSYQGSYKCPPCKKTKKKTPRLEPTSKSVSSTGNIDYEKKVNPDIRRKLSELLNKMMKHKNAVYFLKPVDIKTCPRYYQVVRSPMDLSTAKSNLDKMKYSTIGSFKIDMHKIFTACRTYFNDSSKEHQSADKLEAYFLTELREIY